MISSDDINGVWVTSALLMIRGAQEADLSFVTLQILQQSGGLMKIIENSFFFPLPYDIVYSLTITIAHLKLKINHSIRFKYAMDRLYLPEGWRLNDYPWDDA